MNAKRPTPLGARNYLDARRGYSMRPIVGRPQSRRSAGRPRLVLLVALAAILTIGVWYVAPLSQVAAPLSQVVAPSLTRMPAVERDSALAAEVQGILSGAPGQYAVAIRDGTTGRGLLVDAREVFLSASLYKLGVLLEVFREADAGQLSLDEKLKLTDPAYLEDEPENGLSLNQVVTVGEAARLMAIISSNASAHLLVDRVGRANVNQTLARAGLEGTRLPSASPSWLPVVGRDASVTTAGDMLTYFESLRRGELGNARVSAQTRALLEDQRVNDRIPEPLPEGVRVAHKTGDLDTVSHDAGIVTTGMGGYVIVVLSRDAGRATAREVIQNISRATYRRFAGGSG